MNQLNGITERRFAVIKEGALAMLLNAKLNYTSQKILWEEAAHICECIINNMDSTGSMKIPFKNYMERNRISLVCSWSLDVSSTSLNGTNLRSRQQIKHARLS